jgi:superfamily II DNA or RNA helicase
MEKFDLRSYQTDARDTVRADWKAGYNSLLAQLAVGCGKTDLGWAILSEELKAGPLMTRGLWLGHRQELIHQPVQRVREHWPDLVYRVGRVMGLNSSDDAQFVVATIQTLAQSNRLELVLKHGAFSHLIIDEAHHAAADSYKDLITRLREVNPGLRVLGLTATPRGGAGKRGLGNVFDKVAFRFSTLDAIQAGVLCPFSVLGVDLPVSFADVPIVAGDWAEEAAGTLLSATNSLDLIVAVWKKQAAGRTTLAFTPSIYMAGLLAKWFRDAGVPAASVHGGTDKGERKRIIEDYAAGKIQVVTNCQVFTEGFDAPNTSCILMARPTRSDSLYLQIVGRGLRTSLSKTDCIIVDFAPQDARDLVQGGDALETPDLVEKAVSNGAVVHGEGALKIHADLVDADPLALRVRVLNYVTNSPLAWVKSSGWATAGLDQDRVIAVRETPDGRFEVFLAEYKQARVLRTCKTWNDVVTVADTLVSKFKPDILSSKTEAWRSAPATEKQAGFAKTLGLALPEGCTRGVAAQLITDAVIKQQVHDMERQADRNLLKRIIKRAEDSAYTDAGEEDISYFKGILQTLSTGEDLSETVRAELIARAKSMGLMKNPKKPRPKKWKYTHKKPQTTHIPQATHKIVWTPPPPGVSGAKNIAEAVSIALGHKSG